VPHSKPGLDGLTRRRRVVVSQFSLLHLLCWYLDHVAVASTSARAVERLCRHFGLEHSELAIAVLARSDSRVAVQAVGGMPLPNSERLMFAVFAGLC
jgi:hypothetical protein